MLMIRKFFLNAIESMIHGLFRSNGVRTFLTVLFALMQLVQVFGQTLDKDKLNLFFDHLEANNEAMGSMVIVKEGNMLYNRSFGYRLINAPEKLLNTSSTMHRVGSITKMFTAVMIIQLAEEGKLQLNDHLDKFLPQIPNADKITVRDILGHRSGIQDIFSNPDLRPKNRPISRDEMLEIVTKGSPDFEPGTQYAYSNSGYFVLGYLIEKLTGKPYQEAVQERVISKIGLENTYVATESIDLSKNESISYRFFAEWRPVKESHTSLLFGSGSLISTPANLAKFIQALFDSKLVSSESLNEMLVTRDGYGLGIDTFTFANRTFFGHTGGIDGFGSWLAYLPEEKLTIAYTANAKVYPVVKIIEGVVDIYFNRPFTVPNFGSTALDPKILEQYVGVYTRQGAPVKFKVARDSIALYISVNGGPAFQLKAAAKDRFKLESQDMVLEFDVEKKQMTLRRGGGTRVFTKEN